MERTTQDKALEVAIEWASLYIDALGGDSRKYRQALEPLAPLQYQRREIGEGDFVNCTKEQFEYAEGSPTMDTRVIPNPPAAQAASLALGPSMSITDRQIERALKAACMHSTTESRKDMRRAIEAAIDPVHEDDDQPIPDWWKLVPVEPTKEMIHRGRIDKSIQGCALAEACYRAMLAAAPKKDKE